MATEAVANNTKNSPKISGPASNVALASAEQKQSIRINPVSSEAKQQLKQKREQEEKQQVEQKQQQPASQSTQQPQPAQRPMMETSVGADEGKEGEPLMVPGKGKSVGPGDGAAGGKKAFDKRSGTESKSKEQIEQMQRKISESVENDDAANIRVKNRLNPLGTTKKTWDFVLMFIIFYSVIMVPYRISFDVEAKGFSAALDIIFDIFFFADITVNFFTMFEDSEGKMESDLNLIAKEYLSGWFIIDLVSTLPFDKIGKLIMGPDGGAEALRSTKILRALRLIKLVRLLRLLKLEALIEMAADMLQINSKYLMLGSLVFYQFFFAHLIACLWYAIGKVLYDVETGDIIYPEPCLYEGQKKCIDIGFSSYSWVYAQAIETESPIVRYMYSLYWAFATMTTVGYGDVSATNTSERKLSILLMVLGVTIFGYTLLMVALVLLDGDPRQMTRKKKMRGVTEYLGDRKRLPKASSFRIKTHFEDLFAHQEDIFEERDVLFFLHPSYRYRVLRDINANSWSSRIVFLHQFESPLRAALFKVLKPCLCDRGDIMFYQGEIGMQVYFLYHGCVVLKRKKRIEGRISDEHRTVKIAQQGVFGEVSMVSSRLRPYTAQCSTLCHIAFMNKDEIYRIAEDWPQWLQALEDSSVYKMDLLLFGNHVDDHPDFLTDPQLPNDNPDFGKHLPYKITTQPETWDPVQAPRPGETSKQSSVGPATKASPSSSQVVDDQGVVCTPRAAIVYKSPNVNEEEDNADQRDPINTEAHRLFQLWLIHPRYKPKLVWDITVGVFILYSVIIIPYRLGFDIDASPGATFFDRIGDIFFFIDICLTFRTTYQDEDCQYEENGWEIACDYLKSWFMIDFFSTVPIDIIAAESGGGDPAKLRSLKILRVLRLFKLLKLLRLFKLKRLLGAQSAQFTIPPTVADFFRHLFVLVFLTHLASCLWYGISRTDRTPCSVADENEWPPDNGNGYVLYDMPPDDAASGRRLLASPDAGGAGAMDGMYTPMISTGLRGQDEAATGGGPLLPLSDGMLAVSRVAMAWVTAGLYTDGLGTRRRLGKKKSYPWPEPWENITRTWPRKQYYGGWFGRNMTEYESDYADRHDGEWCDDYFNQEKINWVKRYSAGPSYATFVLYDYLDDDNVQYISAMYWCFATFLSVGYGDVTATAGQNHEIFISIVGMSFGTICFAMFLSSVCAVVRLQMQKAEYKDMLARIKDYIRESALSKRMQQKVRSQFEAYSADLSPFYNERLLLSAMPTLLSYEAVKRTYNDKIMGIPFVRDLEAQFQGFVQLAAMHMFPITLQPGECVYRRGVGHRYVFFIRQGAVEVVDGNEEPIETLSAGKFFGQGMLHIMDKHFGQVFHCRYSVYTTLHTVMYSLSHHFFRRVNFLSRECGGVMMEILKPEASWERWFSLEGTP